MPTKEEQWRKVIEILRATDMKVAEGKMKYYTADEIRAKLEDALNEKV